MAGATGVTFGHYHQGRWNLGMAWRDRLLRHFGPGVLGGLTLGDWLRLLRDNRFALSSRYAVRVLAVTHQSAWNSAMGWYEDRRYASRYEVVDVPPPLFVLGHWRSGTTHLHNLLPVLRHHSVGGGARRLP